MKPKTREGAKKPYQKPQLREYGSVQALTKTHNHKVGVNDGSPNKT